VKIDHAHAHAIDGTMPAPAGPRTRGPGDNARMRNKLHQHPTPSPGGIRPLDPKALEIVHGGEIISPRDPATGLPTGKRQ